MYKYYFTVFTPTYNRAYKISVLYESLKKQTYSDFEWLIIDDGSTDETENLINRYINEGFIKIRYIHKENEGKHVAINIGAQEAQGKWFFIVDSDDWILDNALESIRFYCQQIATNENFAGVVGLRGNSIGRVWNSGNINSSAQTKEFTVNETKYIDATPVEYRYKLKINGDRAEVIKTELLKKYKFPSFAAEKFMPERYLWNLLSSDGYKFRWFNQIVYITEYLEDGLTRNGKELAKRNCRSRAYVDNISSGIKQIPIKSRFEFCVNYYRYGKISDDSFFKLYRESKAKVLSLLAIPVAFFIPVK